MVCRDSVHAKKPKEDEDYRKKLFLYSKFFLISKTKNKVNRQNVCPPLQHRHQQEHLLYSSPSHTAAQLHTGYAQPTKEIIILI